jgi:hypothetical protein
MKCKLYPLCFSPTTTLMTYDFPVGWIVLNMFIIYQMNYNKMNQTKTQLPKSLKHI